jgi:phage terminase large subunit
VPGAPPVCGTGGGEFAMIDAAQFWSTYPNLDYVAAFAERHDRLRRIRLRPKELPALLEYYRTHPWDFINDFGVTIDTREIAKGNAALVPFILTPKQRELIEWMYERWRKGEPGTIVKSRDVGASYCAMALLATLCVLERDFAGGIVSATEVKLDRVNDPDTLLYKARVFLKHLPVEFAAGYIEDKHSSYLRIIIPGTNSTITGEAGEQAGRGGRKAIVIADESAHFQHPKAIDAALAATTPCRIDLSSVNGTANSFYERAHNPDIPRFDITWRDDPRRDEAWYEAKRLTTDPVILAQEYDCDFGASTEGALILSAWISSVIGAAEKLGIEAAGERRAGFDVADEGRDKCAVAVRHGVRLTYLEAWSGKGSNIHKSTQRALGICDLRGCPTLDFDSDGLGSGVRGDAVDINAKRVKAGKPAVETVPFRGSAAVYDPDGSMIEGRSNRDHFANAKAQCYWHLRDRFQLTHRVVDAVARGEPIEYDADALISIDPELPQLNALVAELTQPRWVMTAAGKVLIDKAPDGVASPNLADAAMIAFNPFRVAAFFASARTVPPVTQRPVDATLAVPRLDYVFAVTSFVGDAAAVVYVGVNSLDLAQGRRCWILDWDQRELGAAADAWIAEIAARADELQRAVMPITFRAAPVLCDDFDGGWVALLRQRGFPAVPVGDDLPPIAERFDKASPYVRIGGLVKHAEPAERRAVSFRGSTRNFLRELSSSTEVTETNALAIAYATAILTVYWGLPAMPLPVEDVEVLQAPARPGPWRGFRAS